MEQKPPLSAPHKNYFPSHGTIKLMVQSFEAQVYNQFLKLLQHPECGAIVANMKRFTQSLHLGAMVQIPQGTSIRDLQQLVVQQLHQFVVNVEYALLQACNRISARGVENDEPSPVEVNTPGSSDSHTPTAVTLSTPETSEEEVSFSVEVNVSGPSIAGFAEIANRFQKDPIALREGIQRFLMAKLDSLLDFLLYEDYEENQRFIEKLHWLNEWIIPDHLDVPSSLDTLLIDSQPRHGNSSWKSLAESQFSKLSGAKSLQSKLTLLLNIAHIACHLAGELCQISHSRDANSFSDGTGASCQPISLQKDEETHDFLASSFAPTNDTKVDNPSSCQQTPDSQKVAGCVTTTQDGSPSVPRVTFVAADHLLPTLVWITVRCQPQLLYVAVQAVTLYYHPSLLTSEAAYYFTLINSAVAFLQRLNPISGLKECCHAPLRPLEEFTKSIGQLCKGYSFVIPQQLDIVKALFNQVTYCSFLDMLKAPECIDCVHILKQHTEAVQTKCQGFLESPTANLQQLMTAHQPTLALINPEAFDNVITTLLFRLVNKKRAIQPFFTMAQEFHASHLKQRNTKPAVVSSAMAAPPCAFIAQYIVYVLLAECLERFIFGKVGEFIIEWLHNVVHSEEEREESDQNVSRRFWLSYTSPTAHLRSNSSSIVWGKIRDMMLERNPLRGLFLGGVAAFTSTPEPSTSSDIEGTPISTISPLTQIQQVSAFESSVTRNQDKVCSGSRTELKVTDTTALDHSATHEVRVNIQADGEAVDSQRPPESLEPPTDIPQNYFVRHTVVPDAFKRAAICLMEIDDFSTTTVSGWRAHVTFAFRQCPKDAVGLVCRRLQLLQELRSPLEKMKAMIGAIRLAEIALNIPTLITPGAQEPVTVQSHTKGASVPAIRCEDIIAHLVLLLVDAQPVRLEAHLRFLQLYRHPLLAHCKSYKRTLTLVEIAIETAKRLASRINADDALRKSLRPTTPDNTWFYSILRAAVVDTTQTCLLLHT